MSNDSFFVGVSNPDQVRKDLLLASRQIVQGLMAYEKYKDVRQDKLQLVHDLKKTMDGLVLLNRKLRSKLPKVKIPKKDYKYLQDHMFEPEPEPVKKVLPKKKTATKKKVAKKRAAPARKSRLELLKEDLERFDAKLSKLE